jgi:hypothetical protein
VNFEEQIENKIEVNSNRKTVTRNGTQLQPAITFLFEIEILCSTHRWKGYEILQDFGIQGFPIFHLEVGLKSKVVQAV